MPPDDPTARVLLADDHELVRRLLRRALAAHPGLELVGEASDGSEAVELARELAPDVVVLDLAMPYKDGLQVAGELRSHLPACAIIVFSDQDAEQAALAAGADRYIGKAAGFAAAAQAAPSWPSGAERQQQRELAAAPGALGSGEHRAAEALEHPARDREPHPGARQLARAAFEEPEDAVEVGV